MHGLKYFEVKAYRKFARIVKTLRKIQENFKPHKSIIFDQDLYFTRFFENW